MKPTVEKSNRITYIAPDGITLKKYLCNDITVNDFFVVFAQIIEAVKSVDRNSFNMNNLVLNLNYSFINTRTKELHFIYQPIRSMALTSNFASFLYDVAYSVNLGLAEDYGCINMLINFLKAQQTISVQGIEEYILKIYPQVYKQIKRQKPGQSQILQGGDLYYRRNEFEKAEQNDSCLQEYTESTINGEKITSEWFEEFIDIEKFKSWQKNNKYYGKTFSILGDSISTLAGYIPKGYKAFFEGDVCGISDVNAPEDTWWGKVINFFGGKLLINNSYSGSKVTSQDGSFPAGYSEKRINDLSKNGSSPDIIMIYMGFNDWADGVNLEQIDDGCAQVLMNSSYFSDAYYELIYEIKDKYPNAEIICCTLNTTFMSGESAFSFPYERSGVHIEEYNRIIRSNSEAWECKLADLYSYHKPNDTIDGSHPNSEGMNTLAALVCHSVSDDFGKEFIDIENCKLPNNEEKLKIAEISDIKEQKKFCHICGAQLETSDKFCMQCGTKVITANQISDIKEENNPEEVSETEAIIDNRYSLIRQIGKGASSVVYLAQDTKINRVCAVKMVKKTTYANTVAAQESLDEANKLKLLAHISIPQLYDIIDEDDSLSIVMEFLSGKNLAEIIKDSSAPLEEETLVNWSKQLCNVLYYLHTLNPPRIYRDLKPNNIILQPNGIIKLVDFGTMKNYDESCSEDTVHLGTKGYAAPEQFGGRGQTDVRTDIYGFGMTLYHLATGVNPTITPFEFKSISYYRSDISKGLESIIIKCIEVERENRYQSVSEVLKDLMSL